MEGFNERMLDIISVACKVTSTTFAQGKSESWGQQQQIKFTQMWQTSTKSVAGIVQITIGWERKRVWLKHIEHRGFSSDTTSSASQRMQTIELLYNL